MKARYMVLPVGLALALSGCNELLTESPRAVLTTDNFYQNAADAKSAIVAAYRPLAEGNLFDQHMQWALNAAADYARVGPQEENPNIVNLTRIGWDSRNPSTSGPWSGFYASITRANLVLERVPNTPMSETEKAVILGEAKFLRALAYFYLARLYGDVPLVRTVEEQLSNPGRTPTEEVFQQVVTDATEAAAALPLNWGSADRGRATRGAAHALLAELYLWRKDWPQAANYARLVIDSNQYSLVPNYLNAFLPRSEGRPEEIFASQASAATGAPRIRSAEWYYPREMNPNQTGGWATMVPLQWHLDSYPQGDYRREVSYFTLGSLITGAEVTFAPHVHKFRPSTRPGPQDANWPIYRYADVLLMYAEALNEQGQSAEAVTWVNRVRERARRGTGNETRAEPANLPVMGQAALRDAIFEERRWELAFEAKRWFDLVRRGQEFWTAQLARDPTATEVQPHKMLWPIPQAQIDLNRELTQNPGYGQ